MVSNTDVKEAIGNLFKTMEAALEHTQQIDHIERATLKLLFEPELELAHKLQVNNFIRSVVELSDRAEDLSEHIELMVAQKHL